MQSITSTSSMGFIELKKPYPAVVGDLSVGQIEPITDASKSVSMSSSLIAESQRVIAEKPNTAAVAEMLNKVNRQMELNNSSLRFKADESSGKMVVAIYDSTTEELIRQIPSEQALTTAQKLNEFMNRSKSDPMDSTSSVGMLLDSQA